MHNKDEKELHKLGAQIDPSNPDLAIPIQKPNSNDNPNVPPEACNDDSTMPLKGSGFATVMKVNGHDFNIPDPSWDIDELGKYAQRQEQVIWGHFQRMAIDVYLQGQALHSAKEKIKKEKGYGTWGEFRDKYGISKSSDTRARKLFLLVGTPSDLDGQSITAAYVNYGVAKPPQEAEEDSATATESQESESSEESKPEDSESSIPEESSEPEDSTSSKPADDKADDAEADEPPPAKEDENSPLSVLVRLRDRLEYLIKETKECDWEKEPVDGCHRVVGEIGCIATTTSFKKRQLRLSSD